MRIVIPRQSTFKKYIAPNGDIFGQNPSYSDAKDNKIIDINNDDGQQLQ